MTSLYEVAFGPDSVPLLCVAETAEEARLIAMGRAEELEIATVTNPAITLAGQYPDYDDFRRRFTLRKNRHDAVALGGCLFGGTGSELREIQTAAPERLWTLIEDNDVWWIWLGGHLVNGLGYLITNEPRLNEEKVYL